MSGNWEIIIFGGFIIINLVLGLYFSKGVKTIREYAIGDRDFSTATIVATLVATWITGEFFFGDIVENYNNGMYMMWAGVIGSLVALLSIGIFFAPRLAEFLGILSIAEAMGGLFGKNVRILTAISGIIAASGMVAVQFKVAGTVFEYLGVPGKYGILIAGVIITLYSSLGGIKSVTFTDVIQFFTFGTIIPIIGFFILNSLNSLDDVQVVFSTNKLFDLREVFDFSQPKAFFYLILFFYIAIPGFGPPIFQRIAMAKDVFQVRRSFIIAAITCTFITISICWISILIYVKQPNLAHNDIVKYLVFNNAYPELKILILVSVMAMVMSTADSYINSTSILVVHDIFESLNIRILDNRLIESRLFSALIGIFAITLAFRDGGLMQLLIGTSSFYMPIVTVPFIMALLGFRSTEKSVLIGMFAGFLTVILWDYVFSKPFFNLDSLIPAMISNLVSLVSSHYLLKQNGGWVGIKDKSALEFLQRQRARKIREFVSKVKQLRLLEIFKINTPSNEVTYMYLGLFCIISTYVTMHTIPKETQILYHNLLNLIITSVLFSSTLLISYPIWPVPLKRSNVIAIVWNLMLFYALICAGLLLVIISKFAQLQVMIFMINLIMISILVRWQWALFLIVTGICLTTFVANSYHFIDTEPSRFISLEFQVVYLLLFLSSILLVFFKPKQEQYDLTEEKSDYLAHKLDDQKTELRKSLELKQEFLRNLEHEARTPITGISSMGQVLWDNYDKLSEQQRRQGVKDIAKSSERLNSLVSNILNLSKLSGLNYQLNIEDINFSELVYERVKICKKLYTEDKYKDLQEVTLDISDNIIVSCDKDYITTAIDNIVINALQYCTDGKITIILYKNEQKEVTFKVQDEGIGIPKEELFDVFGSFSVSSKTKTPAGGRGVGLALCKKVIDLHNGSIWAKQNSDKGVTVGFNLPLKN
jgi:Na+/proline symporter/two-component sensor histidine kinase